MLEKPARAPITETTRPETASSSSPAPGVRLQVSAVPKLNLADFQNAVPALRELVIINETDAAIRELQLTVHSEPPFLTPYRWNLDTVGAGETFHVSNLDVKLDGSLLARLNESAPATLRFELKTSAEDCRVLAVHEQVVDLLARNQWGGIGQLPEMIAAFVRPNDPAIDRLLKSAAQALEASGRPGAIDGYKYGASRAWELASAIWTAVLQRKLNYALPPASFEHSGQKIREPSQVLDAGLATCLDLSLLFAACLEQAHLHPLLIFSQGHAFVGLWLREEEFSTPVVDDITALRKRLKLQELIVFETTLAAQGKPVSFSQALEHGTRQLAEEQQDKFELAVDVKRARMSRIKPLALESAPAETLHIDSTIEQVVQVEAPPALPEAVDEVPTADLDPKDRLARWQRRLLDLSLRNTLLNFKSNKKSIGLDVAADALEDALAEGDRLKLLPSPELMQGQDPRSQQLHESRSLEDLRREHAMEALKKREVFIRLDAKELDVRLVELYRGARSALQEGGANTLFLALGFLEWSRSEKPEKRFRAPLVLQPVTLERKSAASGYTLEAHEDEARFNPTLLEMLRQDFGLELGIPIDDLPQDDAGIDISAIWRRVREGIKNIPGWEVSEEVALSTFSFAKYLMWKDLADRSDELRKSPVVAHLVDTPREPFRSSVDFPEARRLDTDYTPQEVFSPLASDSSQLAAVMAAARGKDFVLIGPPGTGKSQTIANLIAQCLAEGKRVLFVAEKIAALDVVYRRLREVGLGEFCLELHSSKARKADVLSQLQSSWASKGDVNSADWSAKASQLSQLRRQLSTYVARLHHRHPNGLTIYRAIGEVVSGEAVPELRFKWPSIRAHDEAALNALRDLTGRLEANAGAIGPEHLVGGPLCLVEVHDWSATWQRNMVEVARVLAQAGDALQAKARALCEELGLEVDALKRQTCVALASIARALPAAAGNDWRFCALPNSAELCSGLKADVARLAQHRELSSQMSPPWPPELQKPLTRALELLVSRRQLHAKLGPVWPAGLAEELQRGVLSLEEEQRLRSTLSVPYTSGVDALNVIQLQRDWSKAEQAMWPASKLGKRKVRGALEAVIEGSGDPQLPKDLDTLVRIRKLRELIEQIELGPDGHGVWAGLKTRIEVARSALIAHAALEAAQAHRPYTLDGTEFAAGGYCGERWALEIRRLVELQKLDAQIEVNATLGLTSDGLWRGHDTDADALGAALAFEQERLHLRLRGKSSTAHTEVASGRCGARLQKEHELLQRRSLLEAQIVSPTVIAIECSGVWSGLDTDLDLVNQTTRFHSSIAAGLTGLNGEPSALAANRAALHRVLADRSRELAESGAIGRHMRPYLDALETLTRATEAFSGCAGQSDAARQALAALPPDEIASVARQLDAAHHELNAWCGWRHARTAALQAGLGTLVEALEKGLVDPARTPRVFEVNYARWWLANAIDEDEVLKRFVSAEHERRIRDFRAIDDEFTRITRAWIRARLCKDLPELESQGLSSEWGLLRREIAKKRQHLPLRQLLQSIPDAVLRLTPCLLMSPLSIAQYLSANTSDFDLVVFDEASQIPVWDAIGAMARGKQVVMVGDPKQLPPTNFFGRSDAEDDGDDVVEGDMESILDECMGAGLPRMSLNWHYRSRHESLIAFSNHRYYGGSLVTFPSPVTEDRAVSLHPVQGRYEKGGARINQPEAKALVADLVGRLRSTAFRDAGLTVGVVTFNSEQQRLILDLLDEERRRDPGLEPHFADVQSEPVFVKNLESVQGDERDIMYFSITYGPDLGGAMSMNFGPLNRDGGERRLNVAVTRARLELRVFASIRGDQIDLSRTKAGGVRDLKHFLEFAERGPRALAEAHRGSVGDFDSPFEASVAAALERKGWTVHTQIGASSFRVDLGVVHPDYAGRYLAGVECDGATYHSSATARDRDKLREQVLRGLGWEILRIWSTDWWVNAGGTAERIHIRLRELLEADRRKREHEAAEQTQTQEKEKDLTEHQIEADEYAAGTPQHDDGPSTTWVDIDISDEPIPSAEVIAEASETLQRAASGSGRSDDVDLNIGASSSEPRQTRGSTDEPSPYARDAGASTVPPPATTRRSTRLHFQVTNPAEAVPAGVLVADRYYEPSHDHVLIAMVEWVVNREGPVLDQTLARRIARAHGFQRTGHRIQERVEALARERFGRTEESAGTFYWPASIAPGSSVPFRWPAHEMRDRDVDEICDQELRSLALAVLESPRSADDVVTVMAQALGLSRIRSATRQRLERALASDPT